MSDQPNSQKPPKRWNNMYTAILVVNVVLVLFFYFVIELVIL